MKSGTELIAEERQRQIEVEKWDYSHDELYENGEMMGAAGCYVANALTKHRETQSHTNQSPLAKFQVYDFGELDFLVNSGDRGDRRVRKAGWVDGWPWDKQWDKRKKHDKQRSLVIAGALIAAELDRINKTQPPVAALPQYQIDYYENKIEMLNKIAAQPGAALPDAVGFAVWAAKENYEFNVNRISWCKRKLLHPEWLTSQELYTLYLKQLK